MLGRPYWYLICAGLLFLSACGAKPNSGGLPGTATASTGNLPSNPPANCPITRAPNAAFTPPAPYPATPPPAYVGNFWFGSAELWTMLGAEGTWASLPLANGGYTQKIFWWRQGYDMDAEPKPALTVTGNRLDGSAAALTASEANNARADFGEAMVVGVEIPTPGCWEITGHYKDHELSFVI